MAPRVFLSSTIRDLADLRSAVRFFLEQFNFYRTFLEKLGVKPE